MRIQSSLALAALITATLVTPAQAITVSGYAGTTSNVVGATLQNGFEGTLGALVLNETGSYNTNNGANPGGGGNFAGLAGQTYTMNFNTMLDYVGFLWGTPDGYNTFQLYNGNTQVGSTYTGSVVSGGNFTNFLAQNSNEYFNKIVFSSASCCFELDNVYARGATSQAPTPDDTLLVGTGLALLVHRQRRKTRKA